MVNLIILHAYPIHTIRILSPDSEKSVRLIITFHIEVSGEQLPTSISTWTCKFTVRILPIYKVCPQTYLQIYLHLHTTQFQHVWGPSYHSAEFACMLLPWKPMYFEQLICVCHILGLLIVQVIAHNLKRIWWYLNIAEVYYSLYCIRNYLNYQYKYWDM